MLVPELNSEFGFFVQRREMCRALKQAFMQERLKLHAAGLDPVRRR